MLASSADWSGRSTTGRPSACTQSANAFCQAGDDWTFKACFFRRSADSAGNSAVVLDSGLYRRTPKMARLEAVLMIADGSLSARRLSQLATLADAAEARQLVDSLNAAYDACGSAFRIERVATGFQMMTRPEFAFWLDKLHQRQTELKLSSPAMETLAIVAYRQPVTRADVEAVRGVQCSEMLKFLLEKGLIRISGKDDSLGTPYLYETTRLFLERFGLRQLDDLPMADHLRKKSAPKTPANDDDDAESPPDEAEETEPTLMDGEQGDPVEDPPEDPTDDSPDDSPDGRPESQVPGGLVGQESEILEG